MIISNNKGLDIKVEAKSPNKISNKNKTENFSYQSKEIVTIQNPLSFYTCYGYVSVKKEEFQENSQVPIYKKIKDNKSNPASYLHFGSIHVK
jgi:hypothetical protein